MANIDVRSVRSDRSDRSLVPQEPLHLVEQPVGGAVVIGEVLDVVLAFQEPDVGDRVLVLGDEVVELGAAGEFPENADG